MQPTAEERATNKETKRKTSKVDSVVATDSYKGTGAAAVTGNAALAANVGVVLNNLEADSAS